MTVVEFCLVSIQVACRIASMLLKSLSFKHIVMFFTIMLGTCGSPINNGFSLKFNPVSLKEDVKIKSFGSLFAKVPQEASSVSHEILPDTIFPQVADYDMGCTNQIAKIFPSRAFSEHNESRSGDKMNVLNVPIVEQPYENYKILVATAPKHITISGDEGAQPLVIYIIFHDDATDTSKPIKMPAIYFVSKVAGNVESKRKEKADPIFIIDSNRTVTGLKSSEVSKYIKFRNKLRNNFKYRVVP